MSTLNGTAPKDTFKDLLQVSNLNQGIDTTVRAVSDGEGTGSQFFLSTTITRIGATGTLDFATGAIFDPTNMAAISGTWTDLGIVTTVDIRGGTMDDVIIGAVTPANGSFSNVFTDTIDESSLNAGVTVDGFLIKDGLAAATQISYSNTNSGFAAVTVQAAIDETMTRVTATTTDATKTLLFSLAVPSGESKTIHVKLRGVEDTDNAIALDVVSTAFNTGGTTTLPLPDTGYQVFEGLANTWVVDIEANNTTDKIEVNVTGLAATTIIWSAVITEI